MVPALFLFVIGQLGLCSESLVNFDSNDSLAQTRTIQAPLLYPLDSLQADAVTQLLSAGDNVGCRLAARVDNTNSTLDLYLKDSSDYEPYFLKGDLNGDGREDFVIVLKCDSLFTVYWFRAMTCGYALGDKVVALNWMDKCGLFFRGNDLIVGEFYSDNTLVFSWSKTTGKLELRISAED